MIDIFALSLRLMRRHIRSFCMAFVRVANLPFLSGHKARAQNRLPTCLRKKVVEVF
jgi:hypothetical protein